MQKIMYELLILRKGRDVVCERLIMREPILLVNGGEWEKANEREPAIPRDDGHTVPCVRFVFAMSGRRSESAVLGENT